MPRKKMKKNKKVDVVEISPKKSSARIIEPERTITRKLPGKNKVVPDAVKVAPLPLLRQEEEPLEKGKMHIVWLTSEAAPYAKTGGLADVSGALPHALAAKGHKVSVIMPYYPKMMGEYNKKLKVRYHTLGVPILDRTEWGQILEHKISPRLSFYFIEYHRFFDRQALYDWNGIEYADNAERFIFFCRAAMQAILALELCPDIIHTNDWHTSLCCVYARSPLYRKYHNFEKTKTVLTIHNIAYQGVFHKPALYFTGLGWEYFTYRYLEFYDQINLLKGGVMTADVVNTVSPTHAKEILSQDGGFNLEAPLRERASQGNLRGILNGIDVVFWNPKTDKYLPARYSADKLHLKSVCKAELQRAFNLNISQGTPVLGIVSRLAYQKGIDVFAGAVEELLRNDDMQFAILASGEPKLQSWLSHLAWKYRERFGVYIGYNEKFAHLIQAGCDFTVMPSRYEPCGLNQMYSMRYGTPPIVRSTGGLEDTVVNYDSKNYSESTGFKFWDLNNHSIVGSLRWAASVYRNEQEGYRQLQLNCMRQDFSWDHTASLYEKMYQDATA